MLNKISKVLFSGFETFFGRLSDRSRHKDLLKSTPSITQAIDNINNRWKIEYKETDDEPIFVLSAGWRSGSTLLQRLVVSGQDILIWGEPYTHCDLVRILASTLRIFQQELPPDQFFIDYYLSDSDSKRLLSDSWIANLYPMPNDLIESQRQLFISLYKKTAEEAGFKRWGFKEVRLSAEYATYLRYLFPKAKFLFLYRNPYNAYQSYKSFRAWYDKWPNHPIFTAKQFGNTWKIISESFLTNYKIMNAFMIKYEDLAGGQIDFSRLSEYLGVNIQPETLSTMVSGKRARKLNALTFMERKLLQSAVEPVASRLGYSL